MRHLRIGQGCSGPGKTTELLHSVQELGRRLGVPDIEPFQMPPVLPTRPRMPAALQAHIDGAGGRRIPIHDDDELQLPDGINVEEARSAFRMWKHLLLKIPQVFIALIINLPWAQTN